MRAVLKAKMVAVEDPAAAAVGKVSGAAGGVYVVANTGQSGLLGFVYALKGAGQVQVVEKEFAGAGGAKVPAGSVVVTGAADEAMAGALKLAGLDAVRMDATPSGVAMHAVKAPRVAMMHTWLSTQTEGWWRYGFDHEGVPYSYISVQTVANEADLRGEVRRDCVCASRGGELAGDPERVADVWECAAVEDDGVDAEPGAD